MSKTVRLVNANLGKAENIETDVETWGELQANETVKEYIEGNVQAVIRENQNVLDYDQAELPTDDLAGEDKDYDFSLFFITKESKAGADKYDDMGFQALRSECADRDSIEGDSGNYGSSTSMRRKLREDDADSGEEASEEDSSQLDRIEDKVDTILDAIEQAPVAGEDTPIADQYNDEEEEDENAPSEDELDFAKNL